MDSPEKNQTAEPALLGLRRRPDADIKLLRVELQPKGLSPIEGLGFEWSPAQPTDTLSPAQAAATLGLDEWSPASLVKQRYRTLQLRYPPEQFSEKHLQWRPAAEMLSIPLLRLNWYWQSGCIPWPLAFTKASGQSLMQKQNMLLKPTPQGFLNSVNLGTPAPWCKIRD